MKEKRDLAADLKILTSIPRDPEDPVDNVHDVVAPHALRRAIAAEEALESARARGDRWEKAFDNADRQYLNQEKISADLRKQLAEAKESRRKAISEFPEELFNKAAELDQIKAGNHPDWALRSTEDLRDIHLLESQLAGAQQTIARQEEALEFYAEEGNYLEHIIGWGPEIPAVKDGGKRARKALSIKERSTQS